MTEDEICETLEVRRGASADVVKASFRRLALAHHPDQRGGDAHRFAQISAAYGAWHQLQRTPTTGAAATQQQLDDVLAVLRDSLRPPPARVPHRWIAVLVVAIALAILFTVLR